MLRNLELHPSGFRLCHKLEPVLENAKEKTKPIPQIQPGTPSPCFFNGSLGLLRHHFGFLRPAIPIGEKQLFREKKSRRGVAQGEFKRDLLFDNRINAEVSPAVLRGDTIAREIGCPSFAASDKGRAPA